MSSNAQVALTAETSPLVVRGLSKTYWIRKTIWGKGVPVVAASGINIEIARGTTLALVGESGCGKSTVARCISCLETPDDGEIWLDGTNIADLKSRELRPFRTRVQMIFQDPATAMNPRMSAAQVIEEPLRIQNRGTSVDRRERAATLMTEVGLSSDWLDRRITEFSGGQKQRIAIARALIVEPRVLLLDEALTGLDLSTQAQIIDLLLRLQSMHSLSYLLISHDLTVVAKIANSVAVMAAGRIVEQGTTAEIVGNPAQPETRGLISAGERLRRAFAKADGASA